MSHTEVGEKKRWKIHFIGYPACQLQRGGRHDPGEIIRAQDTRNTEAEI
jgi:hypothetical protein